MAVLVLNKDEIGALSLLSGIRINSFSLLNGIKGFDRETFQTKTKIHEEIMKEFQKDGAVWQTKDGKPHLIRELQGVFDIINSPKKTIKVKTASDKPFVEHFFSYKGDMGVLFSVSKEEKFYNITYPISQQLFSTWFSDEIIGNLDVVDKSEFHEEWKLNSDEFNLLSMLIINNNYNKLKSKDAELNLDELMTDDMLEFINKNNFVRLDQAFVKGIVEGNNFDNIIGSLSEKGIIKLKDGIVIINDVLANGFSSGNLRDVVEIKEISPFMRNKNFYITNLGYITIEPVLAKPMDWKISIEGLKIYPFKLMKKILEFSDFEPNEELKKELIKHINK